MSSDALPVVPLVMGLLALGGVGAALLAWRSAGCPGAPGRASSAGADTARSTEPGDGRPGPG